MDWWILGIIITIVIPVIVWLIVMAHEDVYIIKSSTIESEQRKKGTRKTVGKL